MDIFEQLESEVRGYSRAWPATFVSARGCRQKDAEGREYYDFFSGAGALNYGHNNPVLLKPLLDYLSSGAVVHSLDMKTPAKAEFLETFERVILNPRGLEYKIMFPGPTGTNAVEAALKLARKVTGREHILSFTNAFHGMTLGSLAITGNGMKRRGAGIPLSHSTTIPYDDYLDGETPDFLWLDRVLGDSGSGLDKPAAIIVETVQGEGGLRAARSEWLRGLARLCSEHGVLLIVDDVQAGCGRTGTFFSFEEAGIVPDIVCVSKSISGYGLPMALTMFKPELDQWAPGEHNGTFRGHNPAFVTATAALNEYWTSGELQDHVRHISGVLREELEEIAHRTGALVRGRGLLSGLLYADPDHAERIAAECYTRGLLVETSGPEDEVVKIMPPLTISETELRAGLDILAEAAAEVAAVELVGAR